MGLMDWNDRYGLGVGPMDDQHKALIEKMNALYDRNAAGASKAEVLRLVDELVERTRRHFADEERFMDSIHFVDAAKHKVIHTNLLAKLGEHRVGVERAGKADEAFFNFLKFWLTSHICGIDTKYAAASKSPATAGR